MNLALTQEQALLRDTCAKLFATESSPERVRLAEQSGFDAELCLQPAHRLSGKTFLEDGHGSRPLLSSQTVPLAG